MPPLPPAPTVMVFDSGVGGLSIVDAISQRLPECALIYACDNYAFPYGTKSEAELLARVDGVVHRFLRAAPADILVIACNTASTLTLPRLRERFAQPIVGVVPAIKPAARSSRSRVIGLLATPATVARPYTQRLIDEHAGDCRILRLGSSALVEAAEARLRGREPEAALFELIARDLLDQPGGRDMDQLVLACTHFPLLADRLAQVLPPQVTLVDSGEAIARRVHHLTQCLNAQALVARPGSERALFSAPARDIQALGPALESRGLGRARIVAE